MSKASSKAPARSFVDAVRDGVNPELVASMADADLARVVRARNSAMRQRDEERAAKEGNIRALNAAIARAVIAEDAVARVEALAAEWEGSRLKRSAENASRVRAALVGGE